MAALPSYARVILTNYGETFDPAVERTEMERGVPKERLLNTQVLMQLNVTFLFESEQAAIDFDTWYFNTIGRIGWFDMKHPRTGQTLSMRFKDGYCGDLTTVVAGFAYTQRQATLEYMR